MNYTYIIRSEVTGKHYIGSCESIENRLKRHNEGRNRSTKHGAPWKAVHVEVFETRQEAYRREFQIKSYKGGEAFKKLLEF